MLLYDSNADKERYRNYNGKFDYHDLVLITMIIVVMVLVVMIIEAMIIVVMIIVIVMIMIALILIVSVTNLLTNRLVMQEAIPICLKHGHELDQGGRRT